MIKVRVVSTTVYISKHIMTTILVFKNLPYMLPVMPNSDILHRKCERYGTVQKVEIDEDEQIGYVYFENHSDAKRALEQLQGKVFEFLLRDLTQSRTHARLEIHTS